MEDVEEIEVSSNEATISVREHAAVIGEIHHQVKNHLQVLSSLVGLQAARATNPELAVMLRETQNRVRAIAGLYDPGYSVEDLSTIHFGQYLEKLTRELEGFYNLGPRIHLKTSTTDIALDADIAVPLAILSNELISNAFKHAFDVDQIGSIMVTLKYADGSTEAEAQLGDLTVSDDGRGLPPEADIQTAGSMGFYLVRALSQQLRATLEVGTDRGASIRIVFPLTR